MPGLIQTLKNKDLGFLRVVAGFWQIPLEAPDARTGLDQLVPKLLDASRVRGVIEKLPEDSRLALHDLMKNGGQLPWGKFVRRYGILREMGSGRRDRERPYQNPVSATETLWYRAMIGRDFFQSGTELLEFAYVPQDLMQLIPFKDEEERIVFGRSATRRERQKVILTNDTILDQACTLLAWMRLGLLEEELSKHWLNSQLNQYSLTPELLKPYLAAAGFFNEDDHLIAEEIKDFLMCGRGEGLSRLTATWIDSTEINDLRLIPGLKAEGAWQNDPLQARQKVLEMLLEIPPDTWWSLPAFIHDVHNRQPEFQRPAGDYDSWYIRDFDSGEFLRGFENWDSVDGEYIRFLICGPMHWLGIMDLARPSDSETGGPNPVTAFRTSKWADCLLKGEIPENLADENEGLIVRSDGKIVVHRLAPCALRYQVARFCEWEFQKRDQYTYQITPASLEGARGSGFQVSQILSLLISHSSEVPPSIVQALERWDRRGVEASLEKVVVMRVSRPEIIQSLKRTRVKRYLGDPLGSNAVVIQPGGVEKVRSALAEMGFLGEIDIQEF